MVNFSIFGLLQFDFPPIWGVFAALMAVSGEPVKTGPVGPIGRCGSIKMDMI
jgi:hypothetical protein